MGERQKCSYSITSLYKAQNPAKLNDISFEGYIGVPFKRNEMINTTLLISSVVQSCLTLCHCMDCSTPGFPIHYQLPEPTQIHVHCISDAIQPSHPLLSPTPPAFNLSLHQGLFQWVSSSHQVAKLFKFQLHHQSFQWIFRTDLL